MKLRNPRAAIEDYGQAIRFKPSFAPAYNNRGLAHALLGNRQAAIDDLQKAADLFQQQGDRRNRQKAIKLLEKLK